MPGTPTNRDTIRQVMQGNRSRDTKPELAVRRLLHARGLRYRVNARVEPDLRRTADILFTRRRVAVFIDGCYWHGCPEHFRPPKSNHEFWLAKINRNRERDVETSGILRHRGWTVLRFWTHQDVIEVVHEIEEHARAASSLKDIPVRDPPAQ